MKKSKKFLCLLLLVLMMFSVFSSTVSVALADSNVKTATADIYNGYEPPKAGPRTNLDYIEYNYSGAISAISRGLNTLSSEINLQSYHLQRNDFNNIILYLIQYKQYYYLADNFPYIYSVDNGEVISAKPIYNMSKSEVIAGNNLIKEKMSQLVAEASSFSTDIEKILYVHDYVVGNVEYDFSYNQDHNNIYYALKDGKTMCVGYSELFNYALTLLGIKSYIVTSNANNHAWNLVYLDGRYYHVDCTGDDPYYTNPNLLTNPVSGSYSYSDFMCSDTVAAQNGHKSNDWQVNGINIYGYANSKTYDNFFWRNLEEHMVYAGGYWYVPIVRNSDSSSDAGFTINQIKFINNTKYNTAHQKEIYSYYTIGSQKSIIYYPVFQSLGGVMYYRTSDGIFAYNPDSDADTLIYKPTKDLNIYDFSMDAETNTLSVMYGNSPDDNGILLKYKISDYLCGNSHQYEWKNKNGSLVMMCVRCGDVIKKLQFTDIGSCAYYGDFIEYTSSFNKFITGTNPPYNTVFEPVRAINRAMMVTILYRMAGEPYANGGNPYTSSPFTDITDTSVYYYDAACWALKNGVTTETTFKPFNNVTREQTATFLYRYAQDNDKLGDADYKNVNLNDYHDGNSISHFAVDAMKWANYNSMITGTQQGYANPQGATQRIHATKILYGFGKVCNIGNFG